MVVVVAEADLVHALQSETEKEADVVLRATVLVDLDPDLNPNRLSKSRIYKPSPAMNDKLKCT